MLFFCVVLSALYIVNILNPVHSVFFLILTFLAGSLYFFILRNEFIAIIFVIIYIGAIAVLFLFVIMLLDVKIIELQSNSISYVPISLLFLILFFFEILYFYKSSLFFTLPLDSKMAYVNWLDFYVMKNTNVHILGFFLYTNYFLVFIFCGFLLFIATLGSILLTFISLRNTPYSHSLRYESLVYNYFVEYDKVIKKLI